MKEFAAGKLVRQAAKLKFEKIREKIDLCEELDLSVKSGLLKDTDAVSYTHLDVYKRQISDWYGA